MICIIKKVVKEMRKANKKLSIGTSLITFVVAIIWVIKIIFSDIIPSQEQAWAMVIIWLGMSSVSFGSDLRGFLKIIKGIKDDEDKK